MEQARLGGGDGMIFDNPMYDWIAVGALANLAYWIVLAFTRTATRTAEAASDRSRGAGRARVEPEFDADDGYDEPYQAAAPEPEPVDPIVRAHAVLGLLPGASSVEIKAAFRRRVSR
jgi:hypothetical protein